MTQLYENVYYDVKIHRSSGFLNLEKITRVFRIPFTVILRKIKMRPMAVRLGLSVVRSAHTQHSQTLVSVPPGKNRPKNCLHVGKINVFPQENTPEPQIFEAID